MARKRRRPDRTAQREEEERTPAEVLEEVQVAAAIQSAMLALAPSTGLRVDVDAEVGVVCLRGEVASEEQKAEAERIVRQLRLPCVRRVRNELVVNPLLPPLPHP